MVVLSKNTGGIAALNQGTRSEEEHAEKASEKNTNVQSC
jgi:hypothetical protein